MANVKSAKKRILVIATKTLANKAVKSDLKTAIKKAQAAIDNDAADRQSIRPARRASSRRIRLPAGSPASPVG